jgi:phosphoesterase RecJ-like protein
MSNMDELKQLLSSPQQIVITTHQRPDGDAIGSSLAMFHYLKAKGHHATVISPTDYPDFLKWMPGNDSVILYDTNAKRAKEIVTASSVIFCLDFNKLYRLEELGKLIEASAAQKILIDHHLDPDSFAKYVFSDSNACSTAELVYDFILKTDEKKFITPDIATCIYTGILTDTDRFRIPKTSPLVHRIAADLLETGINHSKIYEEVYETFSESRLRFFGDCIRNKMEIFSELRTGIIALTREEMKHYGIGIGDTEGLVNYPLWIRGITLSVLLTERKEEVKLSLRSKGNFSAEKIAREFFEGGGHRNASGGTSKLSVAATREKLLAILAPLKNELNS